MDDVNSRLESIREAKKFSLGHKIDALNELILQRFQALTTISSISFAVAGILISVRSDLIRCQPLAVFATALLVLVALVSLGRHLCLIRVEIEGMAEKIAELPDEDWNEPLEQKLFGADWWPEILFGVLVISIILFVISLV